jgi:LysR family glycine cleavage system transcriptional activator/LysR family transcriptional regulator of beta-lactamase
MRKWRSLTALRACEAVARTGSVSAAAEELRVTRPAISKQIALLEQDLGCALFHRTGNRIQPTPAGDALCLGLRQAFDLISSTTESVARAAAQGQRVRLLVCRDFAASWLGGQVGAFLVANPGISVEITAEKNGTFRLDEDFDFRIYYGLHGRHPKGALTESELCRWIDLAVCTAGFADRYLQQGQTAEIPHLIDANYDVLDECLRLCGHDLDRSRLRRTLFNESTLPVKVAASGGGLAVGDTFLTLPMIRLDEVTVPFGAGLVSAQTYSLFTPLRDRTKAAARFERWLRAAVADYQSSVLEQLSARGIRVIERP